MRICGVRVLYLRLRGSRARNVKQGEEPVERSIAVSRVYWYAEVGTVQTLSEVTLTQRAMHAEERR